MNLGKDVLISKCLTYGTGSAVRNGAELDMQGYDGVLAIMSTGGIDSSATGDLHFETATVTGFAGGTDLLGTALATDGSDDDQVFVIDLYKPLERFIRAVVTKDTTNSAEETVVYVQYKGIKRPEVNNVDDAVSYELNISPARGTK